MKILIAHPYKHHVLHFAAGCAHAGHDLTLVVPLYRSGLGRIVEMVPGMVGRKMSGYYHPRLDKRVIRSPVTWQIRKMLAILRHHDKGFQVAFDEWVAAQLAAAMIKPDIVVTLQDYMPTTVTRCAALGIATHSDQISNQSSDVQRRVQRHLKSLDSGIVDKHDEQTNTQMLKLAQSITVPSSYCLDGIQGRIQPDQRLFIIPYGVNGARFAPKVQRSSNPGEVRILARANTIRKGAHLLFGALRQVAQTLPRDVRVSVQILGALSSEARDILAASKLPDTVTIRAGNVAFADVPKLLWNSDLFVMPSLTESMSLACCEAMSAGTPLLISQYCGVDLAENGKTGLIFEDSVAGLSAALNDAINRRSIWPQWSRECLDRSTQLTWDNYELQVGQAMSSLR